MKIPTPNLTTSPERPRALSAPTVVRIVRQTSKQTIKLPAKDSLSTNIKNKSGSILSSKRKKSSVMTNGSSITVTFKGSDELLPIENVSQSRKSSSRLSTSSMGSRRPSLIQQGKERLETHFCRINVLLVTMQLGLGTSMSALGIYLKFLSPSLMTRDCIFWAAIPLLATGILGLYFCSPDRRVHTAGIYTAVMRVICVSLSIGCSMVCIVASVMSGSHGNWISIYSTDCQKIVLPISEQNLRSRSSLRDDFTKCCFTIDDSAIHNGTFCSCREQPTRDNLEPLNWTEVAEYQDVNCRYVFSALKDYFILQCALMAIGSGVSIWFVVILWRDKQRPTGAFARALKANKRLRVNQQTTSQHPLQTPSQYSPPLTRIIPKVVIGMYPESPKQTLNGSPLFSESGDDMNSQSQFLPSSNKLISTAHS